MKIEADRKRNWRHSDSAQSWSERTSAVSGRDREHQLDSSLQNGNLWRDDGLLLRYRHKSQNLTDYYLPLISVKRYTTDKPWVTDNFRHLIQCRQNHWETDNLHDINRTEIVSRMTGELRQKFYSRKMMGLRNRDLHIIDGAMSNKLLDSIRNHFISRWLDSPINYTMVTCKTWQTMSMSSSSKWQLISVLSRPEPLLPAAEVITDE